jgi:hypothetical protein
MTPLRVARVASMAPVQDWPVEDLAAHASHRAPWRPYDRRA